MRAVTREEVEKIAGGLMKKMPARLRPLMKKPPGGSGGTPTSGGNGGVGYPTSGGGWDVVAPTSGYGDTWGVITPGPSGGNPPPGGGGGSAPDPGSADAAAASSDYGILTNGILDTYSSAGKDALEAIFGHENISPGTFVKSVSSGHLTVGYGVDLADLTPSLLEGAYDAGYISKGLYTDLEQLLSAQGSAADADLAKDPGVKAVSGGYEFPASDSQGLANLSEIAYGNLMAQVSGSYVAASSGVTQPDGITAPEHLAYLPIDADAALTDVSVRYGSSGMQDQIDGTQFWHDFSSFNWTGAEAALQAAANSATGGDHTRLENDVGLMQGAINGGLQNGYPSAH